MQGSRNASKIGTVSTKYGYCNRWSNGVSKCLSLVATNLRLKVMFDNVSTYMFKNQGVKKHTELNKQHCLSAFANNRYAGGCT